jgi:uncharacterized protein YwqG
MREGRYYETSTNIYEYTQYHVSHDLRIQITQSVDSKSGGRVHTKSRNTIPQETTKCPLTLRREEKPTKCH